ncbi:alpha/beta fold hydrolase [Pseudotabrizicola alkalilacus]|uniref:Alpha/beta hydrolase n=1 Tax=Pseudotabrizicola alkalilacus TaxID=2305252 RepID=A0A411Z4M0_9RHOB|nr:alpha/beta hydrolase [Pseudotabrizicola alkalilacus]RGP38013.1 alpha/beta hydrolase [Pseudotabrizicola alkalilacus]
MTTLVAVPGIMSDHRTWQGVIAAMTHQFQSVHVADTASDEALAAMAARALGATEGDLVIMAHSMGGRVAMEMGRQAPGRIRAMVLSSTAAEPAAPGESEKRYARIAEANAGMAAYARHWAPKVVSKAGAENVGLLSAIRQMVEDCPPEVHARQNLALLHRPDALAYLPQFTFPTLLITGSEDHLSTEAVHAEIARALPDAESQIVPGGGHLLTFEKPAEVAQVIDDWLMRRQLS